jgi:hypothetical protein
MPQLELWLRNWIRLAEARWLPEVKALIATRCTVVYTRQYTGDGDHAVQTIDLLACGDQLQQFKKLL